MSFSPILHYIFSLLYPPPLPSGLFSHFAKMKSSLSLLWHSLSPMCSLRFSLKLQLRMKKTPFLRWRLYVHVQYLCAVQTFWVVPFKTNLEYYSFGAPTFLRTTVEKVRGGPVSFSVKMQKINNLSASVTLQSILWVKIKNIDV